MRVFIWGMILLISIGLGVLVYVLMFEQREQPPSYVKAWGKQGASAGEFSGPSGVAADRYGNIFVVDSANHRIEKFPVGGTQVDTWGSHGAHETQLDRPQRIAVDASDPKGSVLITDQGNNRVVRYDPRGRYLGQFGIAGFENGQLNRPVGICVDSRGRIVVADTGNDRIQKFDHDGRCLGVIGKSGSAKGEFRQPRGVAVDLQSNIYVADTENHRIQKFDWNGTFLTSWGIHGNKPDQVQFQHPCALAVEDNEFLLVVDRGNNTIHKFRLDGTRVLSFGTTGSGPRQMDHPEDVAVDPEGNVYVADFRNNRVQKLKRHHLFLFGKEQRRGSVAPPLESPSGTPGDPAASPFVGGDAKSTQPNPAAGSPVPPQEQPAAPGHSIKIETVPGPAAPSPAASHTPARDKKPAGSSLQDPDQWKVGPAGPPQPTAVAPQGASPSPGASQP